MSLAAEQTNVVKTLYNQSAKPNSLTDLARRALPTEGLSTGPTLGAAKNDRMIEFFIQRLQNQVPIRPGENPATDFDLLMPPRRRNFQDTERICSAV